MLAFFVWKDLRRDSIDSLGPCTETGDGNVVNRRIGSSLGFPADDAFDDCGFRRGRPDSRANPYSKSLERLAGAVGKRSTNAN